jgi:VWFA-related protein
MCAAGLVILVAAAQDLSTIRVDVNLVNVLCTVRDRQGFLVNHLKQDDFVLLEDGAPQEIRHFAQESDLPLTVGLLVDTSNSQVRLVDSERQAAAQFFSQVIRPKDTAFLISFDAAIELLMQQANSSKSIKAGLERLSEISPHLHAHGSIGRPGGTKLYDAVIRASTSELPKDLGRKAIILITDGEDVGSKMRVADAIDAAQKADAIVYSIYYVDYKAYGSVARIIQPGQLVLQEMSQQTGGHFFRVDKLTPLKKIFDEIQQEMRSQYSLQFVSSNDTADGRYRRLEVLLRDPNLKAQARKGYYAVR